jgi:hypothetical protein
MKNQAHKQSISQFVPGKALASSVKPALPKKQEAMVRANFPTLKPHGRSAPKRQNRL